MNNVTINLKAVASAMARVAALEKAVGGSPADSEFQSAITTTGLGLFRLVVMGEIKKGKSSFINALCGKTGLVPVHSDVATSTVFKIHYGPEVKYSVFFQDLDEGGKPRKLVIPESAVNDYGTESGNPENIKKVDFISVEAPSEILKDGLIIVDTPGVGGLFKKHRDITYRHAPKADAIFFVTDSIESPIGADEVKFLKELRRITGLVYFVQTKAAQVDSEARRRRMENNLSILENEVGIPKSEIRYFVLDSRLKSEGDANHDLDDLNDSGYPALTAYIHRKLKPSKDRNIATLAIRRCRAKMACIQENLKSRRSIFESDSDEKIRALDAQLESVSNGLQEWEADKARELIQEFQLEMNATNADAQAQLGLELRPGGRISELAHSHLIAISGEKSVSDIYGSAAPMLQEVRAQCSEALLRCSEALRSKAESLVAALAEKAGSQLTRKLSIELVGRPLESTGDSSLRLLAEKAQNTTYFATVTTAMKGGGVGVGVASIIGGAIGSIVPVFGTIVGSTAGVLLAGVWGSIIACADQERRDKEMARREVLALVDRELGNMLSLATSELNKATFILRTKADDFMREIISQVKSNLARQKSELQKRKMLDQTQLAEEKTKLEALEKELQAVGKLLQSFELELNV